MAAARKTSGEGRLKVGSKLLAVMLAMVLGLTACSTGTPVSIGGENTPLSETGEVLDGTEGEDLEATEGEDPEAEADEQEAEEGEEGEEAPAAEGEDEGEEAPAEGEEPAADDPMAAAAQLGAAPAASAMGADEWATPSGCQLQIKGGVEGTDYAFAGGILSIKTSTPMIIKNAAGVATSSHSIRVEAGVKADLTIDNVNIYSANAPIDLVTNSDEDGDGVKIKNGAAIVNKTMLYLQLADGSTNTLKCSTFNQNGRPAIRCGWGSVLVVDDSVANVKKGGSKFNLDDIITPQKGMVPRDLTLLNGTKLKKGDSLTFMDATTPGTLNVTSGSHSAGIGSAGKENAGTLIFNGGNIVARVCDYGTYGWGPGNGAGIGSGSGGSGTVMVFNGGNIDAKAGSCGAGIGSALGYYSADHIAGVPPADAIVVPENETDAFGYSFFAIPNNVSWLCCNKSGARPACPAGVHYQGSATSKNYLSVAGDITVNGGYIYAQSGQHGNAFGQSCAHGPSSNHNHVIRVTGGTLKTWTNTITSTDPPRAALGAALGYTIVTGGSLQLELKNGKPAFQGIGGTAYNTMGIEDWDDVTAYLASNNATQLPDGDKVQMLQINLSEDVKVNDVVPARVTVTSWELKIDNKVYDYGAPTYLENGMAYVWVPASATGKNVTVTMSYLGADGQEKSPEPLYVEEVGGTAGGTLKRYIDIDVNKLEDPEQKEYFSSLKKDYDGLTLAPFDIANNPIDTTNFEDTGKKLSDPAAVTTTYQLYDKVDGSAIGESVVGTTMPSDTGTFKVQLVSKQYATGNWGNSYWGHRITGWAQINPVPAVLTLEGAEWGNLDNKGNWTPTTSANGLAGNRVKVTFSLRSAVGTKPTCKTPTGQVQLKIDGKPFGKPITLTKEEVEKSPFSTYTVTEGAKDASANTEAAIASPDNRWTAHVVYYMDPALADGLLNAKSTLKATSKSDQAQTFAEVLASAMQDILAATATLQAAEGESNEHEVTAEYLPDKNYIEGVEANPQNADATATVIIPVDADATMTDDGGTTYDFADEAPEGVTPIPEGVGGSVKYSSVTKNYADFHKKDKDGNETIAKDYFTLVVDTDSAMPMEWIVSDPAVAELELDDEGNVVYDADGNPKVIVHSCGEVTITMHQPGNAVYNEQTRVINMRIAPDNSIKPDTEARVIWNNLTHPGMPAAPGDEIEYTIVGSNLTDGSAWQDVSLGDIVPSNVTINPGSVQVAKNFGTPDDRDAMSAADLADLDFEPVTDAAVKSNVALPTGEGSEDYKGLEGGSQLSVNVGTVYGGQSTAVKFTVTVNPDIVDRSTMTNGNPPVIPNMPAASGSYGVKEAQDLAPGEEPGTPKDVNDTVIVGITVDDELRAGVLPRDPVMGGADAEIYVSKTAENLTAAEKGRTAPVTLPGDEVSYTITVGNKGADSCLHYPIISDNLPDGVTPVLGTFVLTRVDGTQVPVADDVYSAGTNSVALYVDDLYYGETTSLTFKCNVGDNASTAENMAVTKGTTPSDKWRGEHPEPVAHSDEPIVPDGPKASEILGGTLEGDPANPDDPDGEDSEPGVTIGDVAPGSPLANAKQADPDDPTRKAGPVNPDDPTSVPDDPIMPGDRIVKFGDVDDPDSPQDIADELDRILKETIAADPQATEVDIPVTVERSNPDDPDNPIIENVIVTVPITPEMREQANPTPAPPAIDPENPPVPGTPWTPEDGIYVQDGTPTSETPEPATPGVLIPAKDPVVHGDPSDIKVDKTAENLTSGNDGDTYVGDRVRYTVTVTDTKPGTAWFNVVVRDILPQGVDIDMATAKIVTAAGQEIAVASEAYDPATRILAVNMGDVPGGQTATLVFEADITEMAEGQDIGNTVDAFGTVPSQVDPDDLDPAKRPGPGSAFNPPEGWDKFVEANPPLTNSEPAYPSANAKDNGVKPASSKPAKDADPGAVGGQDGQGGKGSGSGSDGDGWGTGVAAKFLQLAQTGDPLALGIASLALVAIAAAIALVATAVRRRFETDEEW